jgi:hypothetical protein
MYQLQTFFSVKYWNCNNLHRSKSARSEVIVYPTEQPEVVVYFKLYLEIAVYIKSDMEVKVKVKVTIWHAMKEQRELEV